MIEQQRLDEETAERAEKAAGYIVAHLQKSKTPVQVFAHHDLETCKARITELIQENPLHRYGWFKLAAEYEAG